MALSPRTNSKVSDYNINADAFVVVDMMERVLDAVVGLFEQQGVPLPTRRYWMMGPAPAEDCAQVVVCWVQGYLGVPGDQASDGNRCSEPRSGVLNIYITRDYPIGQGGQPPSPEAITEASKWSAVDTAVLLWGLEELNQFGDGFGTAPGVIATVNVSEPNGGVQSTVLNLTRIVG